MHFFTHLPSHQLSFSLSLIQYSCMFINPLNHSLPLFISFAYHPLNSFISSVTVSITHSNHSFRLLLPYKLTLSFSITHSIHSFTFPLSSTHSPTHSHSIPSTYLPTYHRYYPCSSHHTSPSKSKGP